jgi:hypothetical protein
LYKLVIEPHKNCFGNCLEFDFGSVIRRPSSCSGSGALEQELPKRIQEMEVFRQSQSICSYQQCNSYGRRTGLRLDSRTSNKKCCRKCCHQVMSECALRHLQGNEVRIDAYHYSCLLRGQKMSFRITSTIASSEVWVLARNITPRTRVAEGASEAIVLSTTTATHRLTRCPAKQL